MTLVRDRGDAGKVIVCVTHKSRALSHLIGFYEQFNDVPLVGFADEKRSAFVSMMDRLNNNAKAEMAKD